MNHMKAHVAAEHNKDGHTELCQYCLKMFATPADVEEHLIQSHPMQTREGRSGFKCVLCTVCTLEVLFGHWASPLAWCM